MGYGRAAGLLATAGAATGLSPPTAGAGLGTGPSTAGAGLGTGPSTAGARADEALLVACVTAAAGLLMTD